MLFGFVVDPVERAVEPCKPVQHADRRVVSQASVRGVRELQRKILEKQTMLGVALKWVRFGELDRAWKARGEMSVEPPFDVVGE